MKFERVVIGVLQKMSFSCFFFGWICLLVSAVTLNDCYSAETVYHYPAVYPRDCQGVFDRCDSKDSAEIVYPYPAVYPRDCKDIFDRCDSKGISGSGIYLIQPVGSNEPFEVYCDNSTDGGGWTVFQRRLDGSVDFYRNWYQYKNGFGFLDREFWLGNDKLSLLTNQKEYSLRIDIVDINGDPHFVKYDLFRISDEFSKYRLINLDEYDSSSTVGINKMGWHKNKSFSTYDRDNDGWIDYNCAEKHMGAWWFGNLERTVSSDCGVASSYCERFPDDGDACVECGHVHLNAAFNGSGRGTNIFIDELGGNQADINCLIRYTEMKLRPKI